METWHSLVIVAKVCGGVLAFALLVEAVYQFFDRAGKAWRQRQIDAIVEENARVSRREQRLRMWRERDLGQMPTPAHEDDARAQRTHHPTLWPQRDLTDEEKAAIARRMHLVMHNSSTKVN